MIDRGRRHAWLNALSGLLVALPLLLLFALGILYLRSPVQSLNLLDRLVPGARAPHRVAEAVRFDRDTTNRLDIWSTGVKDGRRKPVLIFFYGGSWVNGRRQDYGFVGRAYAARGFIVVIPDYRKVPAARFPSFIADGAVAVRWARDNIARFGGDPDRIGLAGHSAGAYIAVMLTLDRRYLAAAGVDPAIVRAVAGLAGPYDFHPFTWPAARAALGNARDPAMTQPIRFARRDAPPLWLASGTADTEIHARNSIALARRERALGNRATLLRLYPGLGHDGIIMSVSRPFRRLAPVLDESTAFLAAHLR